MNIFLIYIFCCVRTGERVACLIWVCSKAKDCYKSRLPLVCRGAPICGRSRGVDLWSGGRAAEALAAALETLRHRAAVSESQSSQHAPISLMEVLCLRGPPGHPGGVLPKMVGSFCMCVCVCTAAVVKDVTRLLMRHSSGGLLWARLCKRAKREEGRSNLHFKSPL